MSAGRTGHAEAIRVVYDPQKVSYEQLLHTFWRSVDPSVKDRQFCDRGRQYRSAIFYKGEEQKKAAEKSLEQLKKEGRFAQVYTELEALKTFYPAEEYHQNYHRKNPIRYTFYRARCGRDSRLSDIWGDEAGG